MDGRDLGQCHQDIHQMEHRSTLHRGVSLHLGNDKKNSLALVARRELFPGQAEVGD
jgi:hypothetical protein